LLVKRFQERAASGARHPGHADATNLEEFRPQLEAGRLEMMDIGLPTMEIDMTFSERLDIEGLTEKLRSQMQPSLVGAGWRA
jgi:hypothetical protein